MRISGWSLTTVLLAAPALPAQPPQPPVRPAAPPAAAGQPVPGIDAPAAPALDPRNELDALLIQWEQKMKAVQAIEAECVRTETDPVTNTTEVYQGRARFLKPDRAELWMVKQKNRDVYERFLCTGRQLYEFRPQTRLVRVHTLPPRAPGQPALDDNFLGLLSGMDAREAKRRYDLQLVKKDQWYYYLVVKPRLPADKAEFTEARLVLLAQTMLPREISFIPPNGNIIKWDIPRLNPAAAIGPADFAPPQLPRDWKIEQVPSAGLAAPPPGQGGPPPGYAPPPPPPSKVRPSGGT
jgi:TIGR03009 family protein